MCKLLVGSIQEGAQATCWHLSGRWIGFSCETVLVKFLVTLVRKVCNKLDEKVMVNMVGEVLGIHGEWFRYVVIFWWRWFGMMVLAHVIGEHLITQGVKELKAGVLILLLSINWYCVSSYLALCSRDLSWAIWWSICSCLSVLLLSDPIFVVEGSALCLLWHEWSSL